MSEENSRKALEAHAERILGISGKKETAKVVNLAKVKLTNASKGKKNG